MPFQKGQSGNPKGRPPRNVEAGEQLIIAEIFNDQRRRAAVEKQALLAVGGDRAALTWLWERLYGKVPDHVTLANPDGSPLQVGIYLPKIDE